jgi:hypothetical protein
MNDARTFEETETLKNGRTVEIRAVRPVDKVKVADTGGHGYATMCFLPRDRESVGAGDNA